MFSRILVPLDGSKLAERTLPHAIQFARIFGSSLVLLRVLDPSAAGENQQTTDPFHWQVYKAEADIYLKGLASAIGEMNIETEIALLEGRTPENILDFAQTQKIDLLAISTHGAGGLSRWNTSSVFRKVVERIYLPVLVIRAYRPDEEENVEKEVEPESAVHNGIAASVGSTASVGSAASLGSAASTGAPLAEAARLPDSAQPAAESDLLNVVAPDNAPAGQPGPQRQDILDLSRPVSYQRILLPIDSSRRAECAVPAATTLAQASGARLILASVIRTPDLPLPQPYSPEVSQLIDQFLAISHASASSYLDEMQSRLQAAVETRLLENDSAVHAIHDLAEKENADLVIFCAHGQTGRIDLPYGSVSRSYIEHGTRHALVIQDVPRSQVRQTEAEIAAEKYGRR